MQEQASRLVKCSHSNRYGRLWLYTCMYMGEGPSGGGGAVTSWQPAQAVHEGALGPTVRNRPALLFHPARCHNGASAVHFDRQKHRVASVQSAKCSLSLSAAVCVKRPPLCAHKACCTDCRHTITHHPFWAGFSPLTWMSMQLTMCRLLKGLPRGSPTQHLHHKAPRAAAAAQITTAVAPAAPQPPATSKVVRACICTWLPAFPAPTATHSSPVVCLRRLQQVQRWCSRRTQTAATAGCLTAWLRLCSLGSQWLCLRQAQC